MTHREKWPHPPGPTSFVASTESVRVAFETARLRLAELQGTNADSRRAAFDLACRLSATTLKVDRVSVWSLRDAGNAIACDVSYDGRGADRLAGAVLLRADCPAYFDAMLERRVIAASDALRDPKTCELADYLRANSVGALLDAPIYREGIIVGIVCHEHVGGPRTWTRTEAEFAGSVADMLTILVEQAERADLRAALEVERTDQARADKMVALQRLARVAVHDINNILTVAMSYSDLIALGKADTHAAKNVSNVLSYSAKLLQQLSDFCREQPSADRVDLVRLLHSTEAPLRTLMGPSVRFELRVPDGELRVSLSSMEAEQLVLNLCMNARDAVAANGHVRVELAREPGSDQVVLEVIDDGVGMDEAVQAKVFEPYFSTKPNHSGVGLMAVYGIVQRAGGSIAITSQPSRGTRFRIALPSSEAPPRHQELPWAF